MTCENIEKKFDGHKKFHIHDMSGQKRGIRFTQKRLLTHDVTEQLSERLDFRFTQKSFSSMTCQSSEKFDLQRKVSHP